MGSSTFSPCKGSLVLVLLCAGMLATQCAARTISQIVEGGEPVLADSEIVAAPVGVPARRQHMETVVDKAVAKLNALAAVPTSSGNQTDDGGARKLAQVQISPFVFSNYAFINDLFWETVTQGAFGGYNADGTPIGSTYVNDAMFTQLMGPKPGQPICVQNKMANGQGEMGGGVALFKQIADIVGLATAAASGDVFGLAMDVTKRVVDTCSAGPTDDLMKAGAFFGLNPGCKSPNPNSIFACDCVMACQVLHLSQLPTDPAKRTQQLLKFAGCAAIRGGQWATPEFPGQLASLYDYLRKTYTPYYFTTLKAYIAKTVRADNDYTKMFKALFMSIDPATYTDKVMASPKTFTCTMMHSTWEVQNPPKP